MKIVAPDHVSLASPVASRVDATSVGGFHHRECDLVEFDDMIVAAVGKRYVRHIVHIVAVYASSASSQPYANASVHHATTGMVYLA